MKVYDSTQRYLVLTALAGLALPFTAGASPIFSNLPSASTVGLTVSSTGWVANSFTTTGAATLGDVIVPLEGISSATGTVTVTLYSDSSGQPGSALSTLGTVQDNTLSTSSFTNETINGNNVSLAASTTYFVVLSGSSSGGDAEWQKSSNDNGTNITGNFWATSTNSGTSWSGHSDVGDFTPLVMEVDPATGTPEPGTIFGMLGGLAAIAAARLRRRK